MSNCMCAATSSNCAEAKAIGAQDPSVKSGAIDDFVKRLRTVASNNIVSINETVKWLILVTENFHVPTLADSLSSIAIQHETNTTSIVDDFYRKYHNDREKLHFDRYDYYRQLMVSKVHAVEGIMNQLVMVLTLESICRLWSRYQYQAGLNLEDFKEVTVLIENIAYAEAKALHKGYHHREIDKTIVDAINRSEEIREQIESMDTNRLLTIDELGWNFRRLADYCDGISSSFKAVDKSDVTTAPETSQVENA